MKGLYMSKITEQDLKHLAQISQITIKEENIQELLQEIKAVLEYASCLKNKEISENLEQLPKNSNIVRQDLANSCDPAPLLALAPKCEERYFVVPVIIKQS